MLCPLCLGEKKISEGQCGMDNKGRPYSVSWERRCPYCDGKGKGNFLVTPEQIRYVFSRFQMESIWPR